MGARIEAPCRFALSGTHRAGLKLGEAVAMPTALRRYDVRGHAHFWTISCFHRLGLFHLDSVKRVAVDGLRHVREKHGICLLG